MSKLPPCDHDECPPTRCLRAPELGGLAGSAPVTGAEVAKLAGALSIQGFQRFASANATDPEDDPDGTLRDGLKRDAKVFEHCACILAAHAAEMPNNADDQRPPSGL